MKPLPTLTATVKVDLPEHMQSGIAHLWETRRHTDVTLLLESSWVSACHAILALQLHGVL